MQMFTVPQFIDAEDKIIGALTVRQFIICLIGFLIIALCYKLVSSMVIFVVIVILCFMVFGALAFAKINGRPFHFFLLNILQTQKKPKLRVWNHKNSLKDIYNEEEDKGDAVQETVNKKLVVPEKSLPSSRLNELSLVVDTRGVYKGGDSADTEILNK